MPNVATIASKLTLDDVEFGRNIERAEKRAQTFAGRTEAAFSRAFKRGPNMRAERAFSGLFQDLASGNIAQGIEAISSRMTGFGLIAGVAIGAGVAVFAKFKAEIDATREAHAALELEMTKRPLSVVSKLSEEGMSQALQTRERLAEEARKKSQSSGLASTLFEGGKEFAARLAGFDISKNAGKERTDQQKLENREGAEAKQIMLDRAALAMSLVNIQNTQLRGYEREAAISKIVLDAEQKRAALQSSGVTHQAFERGDEAISRNAELLIAAENKRSALKERSLVIEEKMAKLVREGLGPEDQKRTRAALELQDLQEQIRSETSDPLRRSLLLQKAQKENEIRGMSPRAPTNPFAGGTIANRQWEEQQGGFGTLQGRANEMNDATAWGSLGAAAMNRGETPQKQSMSAEIVAWLQKLHALETEVWKSP